MGYFMEIEFPEGEFKKTMDELTQAQETIRRCYHRLKNMGVLVVKKETTSLTDGLSEKA